jgi:hypothetical protein
MARNRKNKNPLVGFVAILWVVLNSVAFISLRHYSRAVLPYLLGKVKLSPTDPRKFQTPFSFSYREAQRLGFPSSTFAKALQELVAHGFLDPHTKGGCYGDLKVSNQFTLSNRWMKFGTESFKESDWKSFIQKPRKMKPPQGIGKCINPPGEIDGDSS